MKSFLKFFLASFLALFIFSIIGVFIVVGLVAAASEDKEVKVAPNSVLMVDLGLPYMETELEDPFGEVFGNSAAQIPGLHDLVRIIDKAAKDSSIRVLYLKAGFNANGFAASEEIRNAVIRFRQSKKQVIAYAEYMPQMAYYVATAANKIYLHPSGGLEWAGLSAQLPFIKGTLQKLEVEPLIFYAGKFKSATEPLREFKMTDANRLQTLEMLQDMYSVMLKNTADARLIDSALLRNYANSMAIRTPAKAVELKMIDQVKYDDEVKVELRKLLQLKKDDEISFISTSKYAKAVQFKKMGSIQKKIAVIYAEGDIISGKSEQGTIGSDTYKNLISKARTDKSIKAIVFRINSGGGSSLASETIWRELSLAKKEKPVVISFGDVAASGGYYISCAGDSIFAQPNTITGSIGVFGIFFNMEQFMKNKLGVGFDGVKTGPYADMGNPFRPMTEQEKMFIQQDVDQTYLDFKKKVADNRKMSLEYVDSIAQGRVWTGNRALQLGLVDKIGGIQNAIDCAARMAKLGTDYRLKEFPEKQPFFQKLFSGGQDAVQSHYLQKELGKDGYLLYKESKNWKSNTNQALMRMPFRIQIYSGPFSVQ